MTALNEMQNSTAPERCRLSAAEADGREPDVTYEVEHGEALIYKVTDNPPMHLTILFAFQQALLSLANQLALSLMVAEAVCGDNNSEFKTKLLSTTLFMDGITTVCMVLFGVRLPLFQGAAFEYVVPLLALQTLYPDRCNINIFSESSYFNETLGKNLTLVSNNSAPEWDIIMTQVQSLQGSLMFAGFWHFLIGATGLVGLLLNFVGPVTIVPAILLIGIYMTRAAVKFISVHWGIGILTAALSIIFSLYLSRWKLPIPMWTKKRGCHLLKYPLHQVFAILMAMLIGWGVSGIFTACGLLSDDPQSTEYHARTDIGHEIITNASWFYFPYPGQFGPPNFSVSVFMGFFIATIISILDSIGDYYACAKTCNVPTPPTHAINRGIAIEGLCTFMSGIMGCGHATSTYGGNVGAVGITKVGSRQVFLLTGIIYIAFGLIGKFSAVFITIPHPVLGGVLLTMFGMFIGVVLSNLQYVSLTSTRNLAVIGTSLIVGLAVPYWIEKTPDGIQTGNDNVDRVLRTLLGNANLTGALLACFLDNTLPGTKEERGITAWQSSEKTEDNEPQFRQGDIKIYDPLLPKALKNLKVFKYIPFMPNPQNKARRRQQSDSKSEENHSEL